MKARRGQVALYLVMVLLAIAVLMIVNINAFLAVRSKNRMMNAVDMAAIAAAKYQGQLLNEVGRMNVEHLRAAVLGKPWTDEEGNDQMSVLRRMVFLGPIGAIAEANAAAKNWGYESGVAPKTLSGFRDHIAEIRNREFYPDELWETYADELEAALSGELAVLPGYMEMVNPGTSGLYAHHAFYDVLRAKAWCWFSVGSNGQYLEMDPANLPAPEIYPVDVPENSEVFSLHVTYRGWLDSEWAEEYDESKGRFSMRWTNFVCQVTGLSPGDFSPNSTAADLTQTWAFYDENWRSWSKSFNPSQFPIGGTVREEYDVAGCVASCMMVGQIPQLRRDDKTESANSMPITADAKPLGFVEGLEGGRKPVTAYCGFIAPSRPDGQIFTSAELVLVRAVPRSPGVSMEPNWYAHVKKHAPLNPQGGCDYCSLWNWWLQPGNRTQVRNWLEQNGESCRTKGGSSAETGGYEYAH